MIKSRAVIANGSGQFAIKEILINHPQSDEVLVKITAAGICHTDYDSQNWGKEVVMGHEGTGIVIELGPDVKDLEIGDVVLLNWAIPCYECFQCNEGNLHICEKNSAVTAGNKVSGGHATFTSTTYKDVPIEKAFGLGTMSEYTLLREAACVKSIVDMPVSSAAVIGCGVMTGVGSVFNAAKFKAGSSAVVLGSGGVGLNVIQGLVIAGASKIIAIDINENRLSLAKQFGATDILLASKEDNGLIDASKEVKRLTNGRGADYAFECTAIPALGAAPLAMVRNAGTAIQVSGIEQEIKFDMNLFEWDKIYINPLYGKCNPKRDFPLIQKYYKEGKLKIDELITKTYSLDQLADAFEDMLAGKNAKGVILF